MLYIFRTILVHHQEQLYKLYIAFGICRYVWLLCGYSHTTVRRMISAYAETCRASNRKWSRNHKNFVHLLGLYTYPLRNSVRFTIPVGRYILKGNSPCWEADSRSSSQKIYRHLMILHTTARDLILSCSHHIPFKVNLTIILPSVRKSHQAMSSLQAQELCFVRKNLSIFKETNNNDNYY